MLLDLWPLLSQAPAPPVPAVSYGGGPPRPVEWQELRSLLRWHLQIITTGEAVYTDPAPLVLRLGVASLEAHAAHAVGLRYRTGIDGATVEARTRAVYNVVPGGTRTVIDPDEWIIFL